MVKLRSGSHILQRARSHNVFARMGFYNGSHYYYYYCIVADAISEYIHIRMHFEHFRHADYLCWWDAGCSQHHQTNLRWQHSISTSSISISVFCRLPNDGNDGEILSFFVCLSDIVVTLSISRISLQNYFAICCFSCHVHSILEGNLQ